MLIKHANLAPGQARLADSNQDSQPGNHGSAFDQPMPIQEGGPGMRVLFGLSARFADAASADAPRKDYALLADELSATVVDRDAAARSTVGRLLARTLGMPAALAWLAFQQRHAHDVLFTDGEHIGLPLALLLKLARCPTPHVTIGHRLTAAKKRPLFRVLRVQSHLTRIVVHARRQHELAVSRLAIPAEQLALVPYQVDTTFWRPLPVPEERLIVSAGREFRDYPTLFHAVTGLEARVVVGAASHWSHRRNSAAGMVPPPNVTVGAYDYVALRELYARAALVVVPLYDVDFQAGVTTILEAMAMGKAVVVTHTVGQTDVVEDRRTITRGRPPRTRATALVHDLAAALGQLPEPTGFYVAPSDPHGLRQAIDYLLSHPAVRAQLGSAARRTVEHLFTVEQFAARMSAVVKEAAAVHVSTKMAATGPLAALGTETL